MKEEKVLALEDAVRRAQQGDIKAFEQVYKLTSNFVYSVAFRIANNKADAEEVTQDVFVRVFRNLKDFEFKSSFKTWIYRIALNSAINKYRQAAREKSRRQAYEAQGISHGGMDRDPEFVERESVQKTVDSLLGKLEPEQRACIVLREIEGLSYQEMALVLKININTVRSRLKRARQALLESARLRSS